MRNFLILAALFSSQVTPAQERFVSYEFEDFYEWYHDHSQVEELYQSQTQLYTFTDNTAVHAGPCQDAELVAQLPIGYAVTNIAYNDDYYLPEDEINGYGDIWYHVKGKTPAGKAFHGYIWGADLARGWRSADVTGDGKAEFLMLGISSLPRKTLRDIRAELRIVQNQQLKVAEQVPGLCIFEDCASSPMLRVEHTEQGFPIIEASTMTVGCWAGIERAFYYFDGKGLSRVYHAEYTTKQEFADESFVVSRGNVAQVCEYSHQGQDYLPVWTCKTISSNEDRAAVALHDDRTAHAK